MSIKSGELIHVGNSVLVDRAQTAGPGSLNVPQEHIYELGNYRGVGIVRDIPDLRFSLESLDASAQIEALLAGKDYNDLVDGDKIDMATVKPLDIASQFKKGRTTDAPYEVEASVAIPFVMAESVNYRYGLSQNASQTVSLSGDALYYSRGSAYIQEIDGSGQPGQTFTLDHTVVPYEGDTTNGTRYALAITIAKSGRRLTPFVDYTEQATGSSGIFRTVGVTLSNNITVAANDKIRVIYQSDVLAAYPQASHAPVSSVKPAALRGRDIEVRIAGTAITNRWSSVQSVDLTWSVRLERDLEFGNPNVIGQDFQVPEVRGSVEIKPRDYNELLARVQQVAGVTDDSVTGPLSSVQVPLEIILHSPIDGHVLKTLYVPEARFTIPGFSGRVQTKLTVSFPFESDTGDFFVYKGLRP